MAPTTPWELTFRAMGSDAHVVVLGDAHLLEAARDRVEDLERRWSRFLPDSEVSGLNRSAGRPCRVSPETALLVDRAVEAWRLTGATFEPTILGDLVRAGYDRTFEELGRTLAPPSGCGLRIAATDISVEGDVVTLPEGSGFDPGGIGKGLAADLVVAELLDAGAEGACVNLGGDVRVAGTGPGGHDGWTVDVEHPRRAEPLTRVGLADGAVATSTTLRRRWYVGDEERHHLIDPRTGRPAATDVELVTVVAGSAWVAEVLAKAVLIRGAEHPFDLVDGTGVEALAVLADGTVTTSAGFGRFAGPLQVGGTTQPAPSGL